MPDQSAIESPVAPPPEKPQISHPAEKPTQPVGTAEAQMVRTIDSLGDGHAPDPDKSLQVILNMPSRESTIQSLKSEEASSYKITIQALGERIAQEADPEAVARVRQEMANVVADYVSQLPQEQLTAFIVEFNRTNPGILKSQELRLITSRGERIITVDESGSLKEIVVTKENARATLGEIKAKDETLRGNSYELRREILKRSNGDIATHEAYTYSSNIPQGIEFDAFLDNPDNWIPERRTLQQQIIDAEYEKALALSVRLGDPEPTVYALRGNTAAGKTTATRNDELFRRALDESGHPSGAINPDTYKNGLKTSEAIDGRQSIRHSQAHEEGSMIARKISGKIADSESSMVIDKRMNKAKNITELIAIAEQHGKGVRILDVDVPLETSLIRVLGRKIGGEDPIVPFEAIAEGYEGVRQNRAALIEQVINNPKIKDYVLYATDESGISVKVAQKVNGEFMVIEGQEDAFRRTVGRETASTVAQIADTLIDDAYIEDVLSRTPKSARPEARASLERYKGRTMKEALDLHAQKINEVE